MASAATNGTGANGSEAVYDYIVVGGGTAGLVVASRLSEDEETTVLVIEAGGDHSEDPLILTPGLVAGVYGKDEYDWNFLSASQPTLNGRFINQPRGRMLGGSSAVNFLMGVYPSRGIIDSWGALGNDGWTFDKLEPYFRKFATTHEPSKSAREISRMEGHYDALLTKSESGPVQMSFSEGYGAANSAWFDTFTKLGLQMTKDPRSGSAIGAFQNPATIDPKTKTRSYAATAYLGPEVRKRANLTVLTDAVVSKIILDKPSSGDAVATGVKFRAQDDAEKTIGARKEVILAAGALQSPQVLELSGVGGRELLEKHGIPVIVDNPNVGEHMQDHPVVPLSFQVTPDVPSLDLLRDPNVLQAVVAQYQSTREGPLGQSAISCAYIPLPGSSGPLSTDDRKTFLEKHLPSAINDTSGTVSGQELERKVVKSLLATANEPGLQLFLLPYQIGIPFKPSCIADHLLPVEPENYISIMALLNHPFSRGSCHIASPNVSDKPEWNPNYNAETVDMEILAQAMQFVETFVNTEPFASLLMKDGRRLPDIKATDLEKGRDIVRQRQLSLFHVSSSCAMLPRELGGVVDNRLRVYGVKNLRVVDASVFPLEPSGNILTTVYAVAERAADFIKEDRKTVGV